MKFDPTKPVQCRNGWTVEVLRDFPMVGVVTTPDGRQFGAVWDKSGRYEPDLSAHPYDLVNVPEKKTTYVVFEPDGDCFASDRPEAFADEAGYSIVRIEYTVGQKDL